MRASPKTNLAIAVWAPAIVAALLPILLASGGCAPPAEERTSTTESRLS